MGSSGVRLTATMMRLKNGCSAMSQVGEEPDLSINMGGLCGHVIRYDQVTLTSVI